MGYRSDVAFVVPSDAPRFETMGGFGPSGWCDEMQEKDGYRLYVAKDIKWYSDFEFVQAVEKYVKSNLDQSLLIILGEDDSDTETLGEKWENPFNLNYVRKLTYTDSEDED